MIDINLDQKVVDLKREYDKDFKPTKEYLESLPDLQNSEFDSIPIEFVGISNEQLPLKIKQKDGGVQEVLATIHGNVSLDAFHKGINMSRLSRELLPFVDSVFDINKLGEVLKQYQKSLNSFDAHLIISFDYRLKQDTMRSVDNNGNPLWGYKFYHVVFDPNMDKDGTFKKVMYVDYRYQSCCPCSTALSLHAAQTRGRYAAPHSQRSVARIGIEFEDMVWIEDVIDMCRTAIPSETHTIIKREDEQAQAESCALDGNIFVEDAVRRLAKIFNKDNRIIDYRIVVCHMESIHDFNANAVILKGVPNSIFNHHISNFEYESLRV